jgi:hypothetical protein
LAIVKVNLGKVNLVSYLVSIRKVRFLKKIDTDFG